MRKKSNPAASGMMNAAPAALGIPEDLVKPAQRGLCKAGHCCEA